MSYSIKILQKILSKKVDPRSYQWRKTGYKNPVKEKEFEEGARKAALNKLKELGLDEF
jgi:hypothetical protein